MHTTISKDGEGVLAESEQYLVALAMCEEIPAQLKRSLGELRKHFEIRSLCMTACRQHANDMNPTAALTACCLNGPFGRVRP